MKVITLYRSSYSLETRGCPLDVPCVEDVLRDALVEGLRAGAFYVVDAYLVSDESRLRLFNGQEFLSKDLGRARRRYMRVSRLPVRRRVVPGRWNLVLIAHRLVAVLRGLLGRAWSLGLIVGQQVLFRSVVMHL